MSCNCPNCGIVLPIDFKRVKPQKVRLRSQCLPALKLLVESNRGMTAKELSRFFKHDEKMAQDIEDHFSELRHWRLIRKDGERCYAEERGKLWVSGRIVIMDCVYTVKGVPIEAADLSRKSDSVTFEDLLPPIQIIPDRKPILAPVQPSFPLV